MSPSVLQEWVARAAEAGPERRALVHPDATLTYGQLERFSNRVARALREAGCRRGDRVAFLLPRTPATIATLVGILKADCIYVPLDVRSPGSRLAKVVGTCEPRVLLAGASSEERLVALARAGGLSGDVRLGWMERQPPSWPADAEPPPPEVAHPAFTLADVEGLSAEAPGWRGGPGDAAYILFTSGSTGTPKGVVITHANVIAFVEWSLDYFGLGPTDRLGGYTELTFDLSTFDVHASFAAGAELHLVPEELKLLPPKIVNLMRTAELTHWLSVPSFLEHAARFDSLRPGDLPSMKWITWCGDVLATTPLAYWMERIPHASFANLYGPTEATVASSVYTVPRPLRDPAAPVPIGRACGGEELLILDDDLRPVPAGEVGQLYISGVGLSPGYWRDPERTDEVFLQNPTGTPHERIYRTGDLARSDDEGDLHFLGREDQQIKTRGFRVELGEVEAALGSLPEIQRCAVVGFTQATYPGSLIGCAYVPATDAKGSVAAQKERLATLLPDYMIPVRWKAVEQLPLNDRGKIDRRKVREWMEAET